MPSPPKKSKKDPVARPREPARALRTVAIIGAGRLGTVLGRALTKAGYEIKIAVARRPAHAQRAARAIGRKVIPLAAKDLKQITPEQLKIFDSIALFLITTPDDQIGAVSERLSALIRHSTRSNWKPNVNKTILHSSGALSSEILEPLREAGFSTGSLHPLVSISDPLSNPEIFAGVFFCLEGDSRALRTAERIVHRLGGHSFTLRGRMKPLYHAAAVTTSGHVVALFDIALEMLSHCGLKSRKAQRILLPLLQSTLTNLASKVPAKALTGTFSRADVATARRHLAALQVEGLKDALSAYLLLGRRSAELAPKAGASKENLAAIKRLLQLPARDR